MKKHAKRWTMILAVVGLAGIGMTACDNDNPGEVIDCLGDGDCPLGCECVGTELDPVGECVLIGTGEECRFDCPGGAPACDQDSDCGSPGLTCTDNCCVETATPG